MVDRLVFRSSREMALLLGSVRLGGDESSQPRINGLIDGGVRWDKLLSIAAYHRVLGPLYSNFRVPELAPRIPSEVMRRLERSYMTEVARNLHLQAQLAQLVERLRIAHVPVVLLKGAALVPAVYEDVGLRPMCDVDVLVARHDVARTCELLRTIGYHDQVRACCRARRQRPHHHPKPTLVAPDQIMAVDVHSRIGRRDDIEDVWQRARPVPVSGVEALVPAPEDLVLHLAVHFFGDRQRGTAIKALGQLVDISESLRRFAGTFDWELFTDLALRGGVQSAAFFALRAARDLLDAPVPAERLQRLRPATFDEELYRRFINRRVLRETHWLSARLLHPRRLPLNVLFPSRRYLQERYGGPVRNGRALALYMRRVGRVVGLAAGAVISAGGLPEDFRLSARLRDLS